MEDAAWPSIVKDDVFFSEAASPGVQYVFDSLCNNNSSIPESFYPYVDYGSEGISPCSSTSYLPSPESKSLSPSQISQAVLNGFVDLDTPTLKYNEYKTQYDYNHSPTVQQTNVIVKDEYDEEFSAPVSPDSVESDHKSLNYIHSPDVEGAFGEYKNYPAPGAYRSNDCDVNPDMMPPVPPARTRSKMHDLAVKHRLITDQNPRTNGVIYLSAEEKRTLIQEGYELPTKLPLTREQEEALKIVRRKIKNKLSAQESRRKRKEYIDTLEKKVHNYYNDNMVLRNKLKQYETLNRDLQARIKRLELQQLPLTTQG